MSAPRTWTIPGNAEFITHEVRADVCAPTNATAGLGPAVTIKAYLDGYPRISDSVILSTNVIHEWVLDASIDPDVGTNLVVNPGEKLILPITVENEGNGPDRFDFRLARVTDAYGVDVLWDITIPRQHLQELSRGTYQNFDVLMNVPDQVQAGTYTVVLQAFSEESYPDSAGRETRLRDQLVLNVEVSEFHDMQISMDDTVENAVKTSAPGRVVRYVVNITNNGNVPDVPSLNNHTATRDGDALLWQQLPGMGVLSGWSVEWKMLKQIGVDVVTEEECLNEISTASAFPEDQCVYLTDINEFRLPEMAPYTTNTVVAIIKIATDAKLDTRHIGLKVYSRFGDMSEDGDFDDSPAWEGEDLDSNELILTLKLRAPNLKIESVIVSDYSGDVDSTIPIEITLQNIGNVHATDIEIVLCEYDESSNAIE
jgi:hypothetical protein